MKKAHIFNLLFILLLISSEIFSQFYSNDSPLAHTFSIVARDSVTGEIGVAVQSHWFSVGSIVSWAEAGVGAIATQSFVNVSFGPRGLELLKQGLTPTEVADSLLKSDDGREVRQLAIINSEGETAVFTGSKCIPFAGHINGKNFSVQANLMKSEKVWPAMAEAFKNSSGPLAERMITTLEAAQKAGGDIRGQQSASILIVKGASTGRIWEDRLMDLRVEDHPEAVQEIKRILKVNRAYEHMNKGDLAVEHGDMDLAKKEYGAAEEMFPENEEMKYWHAVTLVNNGNLEESLPMFRDVFEKNGDWKELTPRLVDIGLLTVDDKTLRMIMEAGEERNNQ